MPIRAVRHKRLDNENVHSRNIDRGEFTQQNNESRSNPCNWGNRSNSGAVARQVMDTIVIDGRLAATLIAIFLIPVMVYVIGRFAARRRQRTPDTVLAD